MDPKLKAILARRKERAEGNVSHESHDIRIDENSGSRWERSSMNGSTEPAGGFEEQMGRRREVSERHERSINSQNSFDPELLHFEQSRASVFSQGSFDAEVHLANNNQDDDDNEGSDDSFDPEQAADTAQSVLTAVQETSKLASDAGIDVIEANTGGPAEIPSNEIVEIPSNSLNEFAEQLKNQETKLKKLELAKQTKEKAEEAVLNDTMARPEHETRNGTAEVGRSRTEEAAEDDSNGAARAQDTQDRAAPQTVPRDDSVSRESLNKRNQSVPLEEPGICRRAGASDDSQAGASLCVGVR
jgi:hypothetical protein